MFDYNIALPSYSKPTANFSSSSGLYLCLKIKEVIEEILLLPQNYKSIYYFEINLHSDDTQNRHYFHTDNYLHRHAHLLNHLDHYAHGSRYN